MSKKLWNQLSRHSAVTKIVKQQIQIIQFFHFGKRNTESIQAMIWAYDPCLFLHQRSGLNVSIATSHLERATVWSLLCRKTMFKLIQLSQLTENFGQLSVAWLFEEVTQMGYKHWLALTLVWYWQMGHQLQRLNFAACVHFTSRQTFYSSSPKVKINIAKQKWPIENAEWKGKKESLPRNGCMGKILELDTFKHVINTGKISWWVFHSKHYRFSFVVVVKYDSII
jgi:hypothetical protein